MSDIEKIVGLLSSDALEKRIAAAIVLGELRAKGPAVVDALTHAAGSGVALLQRHALEALARVGAKKAAPKILPLLGAREEEVRRAAVEAMVSIGEDVLPMLRNRIGETNADERRSIDAVLAAVGGKDAFHALLAGLAGSDADAAKAAAIAVRQRVKDADGRQRRSYLAETEKFLDRETRKGGHPGALAAGVKILGFLEDERAIPTLLAFARDKQHASPVRQEALIALRFLVASHGADPARRAGTRSAQQPGRDYDEVVATLVEAAEDADRTLAQTALHTLAGLTVSDKALSRLEKLVGHADGERARFVLEILGRQPGAESARALVGVVATTKDKRRAEVAAASLVARDSASTTARAAQPRDAPWAPGAAPVRDDAVGPLARALLDADDADRAWLLRNVLRPSAKKVPPALRKQMLELGIKRLSAGDRNWEPLLAIVRDADPETATLALRGAAKKLRKTNPDKALTIVRVLCRNEGCSDEDRYALAAAELARGHNDTRAAARAGDESLRLFGALLDRGVDVGARLRDDESLDLAHLYYVGFHFSEEGHPLGEELLRLVAERAGRAKIGKMAKSKLALVEQ
jgi:hypothetical protein